MKKNYANPMEEIFESHDILGNPFMEYTKAQLEVAFNMQQQMYNASPVGSAPRRQAFNMMALVEISFDAYAKAVSKYDVFVDNDTTLRDVLEDSYEIAHGVYKSVEEMRKDAGLPAIIATTADLAGTALEKTKDLSVKASNKFFDGIFHATSWLSNKTDPSNRK